MYQSYAPGSFIQPLEKLNKDIVKDSPKFDLWKLRYESMRRLTALDKASVQEQLDMFYLMLDDELLEHVHKRMGDHQKGSIHYILSELHNAKNSF